MPKHGRQKRCLTRKSLPPETPRKRGAPLGNTNALKHGKHTRERRALFADIRAHIVTGRTLTAALAAAGEPDCPSG